MNLPDIMRQLSVTVTVFRKRVGNKTKGIMREVARLNRRSSSPPNWSRHRMEWQHQVTSHQSSYRLVLPPVSPASRLQVNVETYLKSVVTSNNIHNTASLDGDLKAEGFIFGKLKPLLISQCYDCLIDIDLMISSEDFFQTALVTGFKNYIECILIYKHFLSP